MILIFKSVYIVGTANYFNFMDGIDGIAGLTGIVAFGLMAIFLYINDAHLNFIVMNISLALCCLGFLPFNFPRARVFMGDVGSILIGFAYAAMVIWSSTNLSDFLCLASFLFLFYADEITTAIVRLRDREKLWLPHRRHIYQILANELNFPHWKVSLGYAIIQILIGLSVLVLQSFGMASILTLIGVYCLIFIMISNKIRIKATALRIYP
jgi:Fuc2NAc and GlcNAc transferase